jgi:hypothetical protein
MTSILKTDYAKGHLFNPETDTLQNPVVRRRFPLKLVSFYSPVNRDIAVRVKREPVYGERRAKTVSAESFKPFTIMFSNCPGCVEREAVYFCREWLCIIFYCIQDLNQFAVLYSQNSLRSFCLTPPP